MQASHRHHFIPRFWIKRWCGADGKVARFMKQPDGVIDVLRKPPKSVGYWEGLYSPPTGLPENLQLEELFFKKLDDKTSKIFNKFEEEKIHLSGEEAYTLGIFILTLMHRTPDALEDFYKAGERHLDEVRLELRDRYAELRGPNDPATMEEYEAQQGPDAARKAFYRLFPKLVTNPRIATFLTEMKWMVFHGVDRAFPLLLSDDPLIRTNGLKKADGHIAFPLTPTKLIVAAYRQETLEALKNERRRDLFARVNRQAARTARHFVVAEDESQAHFVRKHFGSGPRPTLGQQMLGFEGTPSKSVLSSEDAAQS